MRAKDVVVSAVLALLLVVIYVCCRWRLKPGDLTGYWRSTEGPTYRMEPVGDTGEHSGLLEQTFLSTGKVRVQGVTAVSEANTRTPDANGAVGKIAFFRRICIGGKCGSVDFGQRHIEWGKERWVREGLT
jgi:hypothetical protein